MYDSERSKFLSLEVISVVDRTAISRIVFDRDKSVGITPGMLFDVQSKANEWIGHYFDMASSVEDGDVLA